VNNKWRLAQSQDRLQDNISKLGTILGILMDAKLQVFSKCLIQATIPKSQVIQLLPRNKCIEQLCIYPIFSMLTIRLWQGK